MAASLGRAQCGTRTSDQRWWDVPHDFETDWPIRQADDLVFLEVARRITSESHFAVLKGEVEAGCKRIRPEEVLGACSCDLPAKFEASKAAGDKAIEKLAAANCI